MKKAAIKPQVKYHIRLRKMWRTRLLESATNMLTPPACNSDDYKDAVAAAAAKVVAWGGGTRPEDSPRGAAPRLAGCR